MSSCPRNSFGQPACYIVDHPDYPHLESYCAECGKRFPKEAGLFQSFVFFISMIVTLLVVLALRSQLGSTNPDVPQRPNQPTGYLTCDRSYGDRCG